jgi:hypothetical protein
MIVVELQGGLGNQLFQYALGRHLAVLNHAQLYLDTGYLNDRGKRKNFTFRTFDLDIFNIDAALAPENISQKYGLHKSFFHKISKRFVAPKPFRFIGEPKFSFNPEILTLPDNVYLNGYWQSEKYFAAITEIIQKDFTLKLSLCAQIQQLQHKIENCNAVCLHVRRGDFVKNGMHGTLGMEYYGKAALMMEQKTTNPVFYIFSDDINWCRDNIQLTGKVIFVGDEFAGEKSAGHFVLMKACHHFIIPNSSFGWWAAWLGNYPGKIVTAPNTWFHNSHWDTKDIIPSNWITL